MIVVDVGCAKQLEEESIPQLVARYQPDLLYGFDPHPATVEGVTELNGTTVVTRQAAMWVRGGIVPLAIPQDTRCCGVELVHNDTTVDVVAVDFVEFLRGLPPPVVVKLDCEGAEYPLLAALAEDGLDSELAGVVVEWHAGGFAHGWEAERPQLACPMEEWTG